MSIKYLMSSTDSVKIQLINAENEQILTEFVSLTKAAKFFGHSSSQTAYKYYGKKNAVEVSFKFKKYKVYLKEK